MKWIFCLLLLIILNGCEKNISFSGEETKPLITLNALAIAGEPIKVYVYKSLFFLDPDSWMTPEKQTLSTALVQMTINNSLPVKMAYDNIDNCFVSDYCPMEGDQLQLKASFEGCDPVEANTTILNSPDFEIVRHNSFYSKIDHYDIPNDDPDWSGTDTIMSITARLRDPAGEKNYYRLNVRSLGALSDSIYYVNDLFTSYDIVFEDKNLSVSYNGWAAYFSNVFDDSIFDGTTYDFTIETRQRTSNYFRPYVVVNLQQISEDYYKYLKTLELYNCSANDIYAEPIRIHSNIKNGTGIFGSLTGTRYTLFF